MKNAVTLTDLLRLSELFQEAALNNHALLLAPIACEVLHKAMTLPPPVPAAPVSNETVPRCKRILELVDDYHDRPTQQTRTTLRKALMDEFDRAALASAPVAPAQPVAAIPEAGQSVHALKLLNDIALWWHADKLGVTDGNPKEFEDLMERAELFMLKAKRLATMSADAQSKGGA